MCWRRPRRQVIRIGDEWCLSGPADDLRMKRRTRADERARDLLLSVARELRTARRSSGLSQATIARVAGLAQSRVSEIERGRSPGVSIRTLCRLADAVGLDLAVRTYVGGDPVRDAAQLRLLARLRRETSLWSWQSEVPLPVPGDRRAWDAVLRRDGLSIAVEAETRPIDVQALVRRLALKWRDGNPDRLILLLADTRWNRALLATHGSELGQQYPISGRAALLALRRGDDPGGDAIVML